MSAYFTGFACCVDSRMLLPAVCVVFHNNAPPACLIFITFHIFHIKFLYHLLRIFKMVRMSNRKYVPEQVF